MRWGNKHKAARGRCETRRDEEEALVLEATDLDWKAIEARSGAGPRSGSLDLGKTLPESSVEVTWWVVPLQLSLSLVEFGNSIG